MRFWNRKLLLIGSGLFWLGSIGVGLNIIWKHEQTPGTAASPSGSWPAESRLPRPSGRATLVMLAHPQCPCTRASIGELALLMAQCRGLVETHVLFYQPAEFPPRWAETEIWRSAAAIPGVTVSHDPGGAEARRFHGATSGQALLYDAAGRLIFNGGITGSRGHAGDNAGRNAITSLLMKGAAERARTPVFGCSLFESQDADQEEANGWKL